MITDTENKSKNVKSDIIEKFRFVPCCKDKGRGVYEILPDGYFDLSFLLSESGCKVFLAGPYTQKTIVPIGSYELFIISFRVGRMPRFLDINPRELVNRVVELPRIFGLDAGAVSEEMMMKKNQLFRQKFILGMLSHADLPAMISDKIYEHAIAVIEASGGQVQVGEIARILGVSNRTLERKFKDVLGFSPKMFARLVRFQKVVEILRSEHVAPRLTDIAYEFGYADQAHFIHDFKELSGVSPASF